MSAKETEVAGEVSLPESELEKWKGIYFDETTGAFAELEIRDGALHWKEARRRLVPMGGAKFVAEAAHIELEGTTMHVKSPGQRGFRYERVEPVAPSVGTLARYIGLYRCSELDVTYRVELGETLELQLESRSSSGPLEPVFEDGFRWSRGSIVFQRDESGRVGGFELAAGRARNLFFERL